jgi:hypothetical protein
MKYFRVRKGRQGGVKAPSVTDFAVTPPPINQGRMKWKSRRIGEDATAL